jgi:hypothetical protein
MTVSLTLRGTKGSALTYQEVDANFTELKSAVEAATTVDTSTFVTTSSLSTQLVAYVTTGTSQSVTGAKTFSNTATFTSNVAVKGVNETVYDWGNVSAGTYTINATSGTIQTMTLTGNVTISSFTNPQAGQAVTLKVKQDATGGRTLTSTMKFAGASKTLSTSTNAIDIVNIVYDGTDYLASLVMGFA